MNGKPSGAPPQPVRPPITPARWAQLRPFVDAALDLAWNRRRAYYDQVRISDPSLAAEIERLVAECDRDDSLLERGAAERFALLFHGSSDPVFGADLRAQLQASLGTVYTLERELAGGGMSRVFLADEPGLGRKVVIKFLAPELAAGINSERFEREIRIAASLQQANIVPLLSAGRTEQLPYYTMPFVDGYSLRERLARDGALPVGEAMNILRDVARALAYAHERGIVHRDIKPGNVLLSGGAAVVSDFGIAEAVSAARGDSGPTIVRRAGGAIGTPAYMSPEQAADDPATNHRTDIYAFGCLAYEVFTGKPPFHGQPVHRIVGTHARDTPPPVIARRPDVPATIAALIGRCLEKDPAARPQSAAEVLRSFDATVVVPAARSSALARVRLLGAAVGIAVVVALGSYVVGRVRDAHTSGLRQPLMLAVLPFRNVSGDTALAYRADGISDEVLTAMAKLPGVRITGRNAALRYKGQSIVDLQNVERELGARFLVTGTLRERGGRLVVSAQLNDSSAHGELWADTFDRDSRSLGSVSDDIARAITDTLRARFGSSIGGGRRAAPTAGTANADALDLYLLGQELVKHRGSGVTQGVRSFERALALDPNFARAWAALAAALELYPFFEGTPPDSVRKRVTTAARRALELDSTLADARTALATAYAFDGQWTAAEREFRHALALEPDNLAARLTFGRNLVCRGRSAEALAQFQAARKVERMSAVLSAWTAYAMAQIGQLDSALSESARAVQLDSTLLPTTNLGAFINLTAGRPDVAVRLVAGETPPTVMSTAPYVYARVGDTVTATRLLHAMESHRPRPWFTDASQAVAMLALGDTARALDALERSSAATGSSWTALMPISEQVFDQLRRSARFIALERRAGLDQQIIASPTGGRRASPLAAARPRA